MPTLTFRAPRLDLERPIFVQSAERPQRVAGKTKNVSESGMLVCMPRPMPVHTELICSLPLQHGRRAVRGRVAWVREESQGPEMGIEFLDLSHLDQEHLHQTLTGGEFCSRSPETDTDTSQSGNAGAPILLSKKRTHTSPQRKRILSTPPPLPRRRTEMLLSSEGTWQRPADSVLSASSTHYSYPFLLVFLAIMGPLTLAASVVPFDLWDATVEKSQRLSSWAAALEMKLTGSSPLQLRFNKIHQAQQKKNAPQIRIVPDGKTPTNHLADAPASIKIHRSVEGTALSLRLKGSLAESQQYRLKEPEGIAFNLPRATAELPYGLYRIGDGGFRTLWLKRRGSGTQVRVLFEDGVAHRRSTQLTKRALTITLHRR